MDVYDKIDKIATPEFRADILSLLDSHASLIYITTHEERRFLDFMKLVATAKGFQVVVWDTFRGPVDLISGKKDLGATDDLRNPDIMLDKIIEITYGDIEAQKILKKSDKAGTIYILLDFHRFMQDISPDTERRLRHFAMKSSTASIVMTGPNYVASAALENSISVLDFPYPNETEIGELLDGVVGSPNIQAKLPFIKSDLEQSRHLLITSLMGLTREEILLAVSKSLVLHRQFNIETILREKRQIIRKKEVLEFWPAETSLKNVGGMQPAIEWIRKRKLAFEAGAAVYGLPQPRGVLFIGMPGCGKSLLAKAIASEYNKPLLRLDFGKLFQSLQGESEMLAREALKLAETIAPCVLWVDELEKALAGTESSGLTDSGTTARIAGSFLTWMQEKTTPVFIVATANDWKKIPAPFMRAQRFDEIFFVDLPTVAERRQILSVLLTKYKRDPANFDLNVLAESATSFSGAEIEKAIVEALFEGYADGREITTSDILSKINVIKPLYDLRKQEFEELRIWAGANCARANLEEVVV